MHWKDLHDHREHLRDWLMSKQPSDESRSNWWLGWALVATGQMQSIVDRQETPDRATLDLAVRVINLATNEGSVSPVNRAIRLANLAGLVAKSGRIIDCPPELAPDIAARRCLGLISEDVADVRGAANEWKSLSIEKTRRLREVKNLVSPLLRLSSYVEDRRLAEEIKGWDAVYFRLP
jgi:hypothetical protein